MVILFTYEERNKETGKAMTLVSHGIDFSTGYNVTVPTVEPYEIGYFNHQLGEWVLR